MYHTKHVEDPQKNHFYFTTIKSAGIAIKDLLKSLLLKKLATQKRHPLHAGKRLHLLNL